MLRQLGPQPREVTSTERDWAPTRRAARGVGKAYELLASTLEELNHRGEALVAGALLEAELVDDRRRPPRSGARLRHPRHRSAHLATCLCRERNERAPFCGALPRRPPQRDGSPSVGRPEQRSSRDRDPDSSGGAVTASRPPRGAAAPPVLPLRQLPASGAGRAARGSGRFAATAATAAGRRSRAIGERGRVNHQDLLFLERREALAQRRSLPRAPRAHRGGHAARLRRGRHGRPAGRTLLTWGGRMSASFPRRRPPLGRDGATPTLARRERRAACTRPMAPRGARDRAAWVELVGWSCPGGAGWGSSPPSRAAWSRRARLAVPAPHPLRGEAALDRARSPARADARPGSWRQCRRLPQRPDWSISSIR